MIQIVRDGKVVEVVDGWCCHVNVVNTLIGVVAVVVVVVIDLVVAGAAVTLILVVVVIDLVVAGAAYKNDIVN